MNDVKAGWLKWRRPLAAVAVGGMLAIGLQGCFGVLAGGMLAGTFAATDRRTLGAQTEDKSIVVKGEANIPDDNRLVFGLRTQRAAIRCSERTCQHATGEHAEAALQHDRKHPANGNRR